MKKAAPLCKCGHARDWHHDDELWNYIAQVCDVDGCPCLDFWEGGVMFDFNIDSISDFGDIAGYAHIWLVEFGDWTQRLVVADDDSCEDFCILEAK